MNPPSKNKSIIIWTILIIAFLGFIFANKIVTLLTDYLWFRELRLSPVFLTILYSKIGCGLIAGFVAWLFIYANVFIATRLARGSQQFTGILDTQLLQLLGRIPLIGAVLFGASIIIACIIGSGATNAWELYLKFVNTVPFGTRDPLFGKDIGFYVFQLPFYRFVYRGALIITFFLICRQCVCLLHQPEVRF